MHDTDDSFLLRRNVQRQETSGEVDGPRRDELVVYTYQRISKIMYRCLGDVYIYIYTYVRMYLHVANLVLKAGFMHMFV